ncbi:MAG TPA: GGDEF domain-containing protein [Gammaproteobacteria bacterium]
MTTSPSRDKTPVAETVDRSLDPLTGTLTRQAFFQRLVERTAIANTSGRTLAICLVNADQFRNVNDQHGQQTGDEVLAKVTRRIRLDLAMQLGAEREVDLCRYDGNGFALLIPDSSLEEASSAAESVRRAVGEKEMQRGLRVTVSVGVAQYRLWESAEDTLSRAEHALQLAKQFGRDRVEVAFSPESAPERADVIPLRP